MWLQQRLTSFSVFPPKWGSPARAVLLPASSLCSAFLFGMVVLTTRIKHTPTPPTPPTPPNPTIHLAWMLSDLVYRHLDLGALSNECRNEPLSWVNHVSCSYVHTLACCKGQVMTRCGLNTANWKEMKNMATEELPLLQAFILSY